MGFDIIGDVHGDAAKLTALLRRLGYVIDPVTGAYAHSERRAVFVGDLIDKGGAQLDTLLIVKAMVDHGAARVVMGNHEFDAIAYAAGGGRRNDTFLDLSADDQRHYTEWFKMLPLGLQLRLERHPITARVVHACWHAESMHELESASALTGGVLDFAKVLDRRANPTLCGTVGVLINGPDVSVADYGALRDGGGSVRTRTWVRWWDAGATTLRDLAYTRGATAEGGGHYPALPAVESDANKYVYREAVPVIYGHYLREWRSRDEDFTPYAACVDFSGGADGPLVAYRWSGEPTLNLSNYVRHDLG
ncbi:metallophosphoesterase [Mycobacterium sp. M26]|uniref:metallophosphoesterase n=1 Tax=Mycobacterium sp. M26 TaxID=1762962 RepID=UPI0018D2144A|nr:metallophosphoesterase [Mycobacterium sp. M26]